MSPTQFRYRSKAAARLEAELAGVQLGTLLRKARGSPETPAPGCRH
jgi:hypothetical protein